MTSDKSRNPSDVPGFTKDSTGYGVVSDGSLFVRQCGENGKAEVEWVSDGYAQIVEEMRKENGDSVFVIEGKCAKDSHAFRFEMDAFDFAEARKLKGKLTAQFGACNRVGGLTGDVIQQISSNVEKFRLIETPRWLDGKAAVHGLDLIPNLKYATNSWVPVNVGGGDLSEAQKGLNKLLSSWDKKLTTIVFAAILGGPIVAKWFPGDRFGVVLRAMTGNGKTEFAKHAMAVYGKGYLDEENLMRWGAGSTGNACMKVAATAGFLPYLVDNYKPLKREDPAQLILLIQAVLEGSDKARLSSDSELKDSAKFACTLIITGEDFPEESSTMARCIILDWSPIHDSNLLTQAQSLVHNFPAIGKEWLTWLSENQALVEDILKDFETKRRDYYREIIALFAGINAGRLSTNLALLDLIWEVALRCPALGDVLSEFTQDFESGFHDLLAKSPREINASNEAEEFVSTLNELIGTGRARIVYDGADVEDLKDVVGWTRAEDEICIFPKVARKLVETVASTQQKVSALTLYKQLDERGYIKTEVNDGSKERTLTRKFGGKANRVLVFKTGIEAKT